MSLTPEQQQRIEEIRESWNKYEEEDAYLAAIQKEIRFLLSALDEAKEKYDELHDSRFEEARKVDALKAENTRLDSEIEKLAKFIMNEIPGVPAQSESAVDCAIRLLKALEARVRELESLIKKLEWGSCDGCGGSGYCPLCRASKFRWKDGDMIPSSHEKNCPVEALNKATKEKE